MKIPFLPKACVNPFSSQRLALRVDVMHSVLNGFMGCMVTGGLEQIGNSGQLTGKNCRGSITIGYEDRKSLC